MFDGSSYHVLYRVLKKNKLFGDIFLEQSLETGGTMNLMIVPYACLEIHGDAMETKFDQKLKICINFPS